MRHPHRKELGGGYYKGSIGVLLKVDLVQMITNVYFTIKDITAALARTVRRLEIKGSGRGCLDHESRVEFPYIHESRYLVKSFHE